MDLWTCGLVIVPVLGHWAIGTFRRDIFIRGKPSATECKDPDPKTKIQGTKCDIKSYKYVWQLI